VHIDDCEAKVALVGEKEEKSWQSGATCDAMLELHFAAPGAACIHSLALSPSYCS